MAKHLKTTFSNSRVILDGNDYDGCTFTNCDLVYTGKRLPNFKDCVFNSPRFGFEDAAGDTMIFLQTLYRSGAAAFVEAILEGVRSGN